MARWRTLNKRARRRRKHDAEFVRNLDKVLKPALEAVMANAIKAAFTELSKQIVKMAEAWAKAGNEMSPNWRPLGYGRPHRKAEQWPDIILEDMLDAEYIGED